MVKLLRNVLGVRFLRHRIYGLFLYVYGEFQSRGRDRIRKLTLRANGLSVSGTRRRFIEIRCLTHDRTVTSKYQRSCTDDGTLDY